jgi:hypothetical protein
MTTPYRQTMIITLETAQITKFVNYSDRTDSRIGSGSVWFSRQKIMIRFDSGKISYFITNKMGDGGVSSPFAEALWISAQQVLFR